MVYTLFSLVIILIIFMVFKAHHDLIEYRTITDDRLPEVFNKFTVFFISDIHRRRINLDTLKKIHKQIHIIIIGGDLTEKGVPLERTKKNLKLLKQFKVPIYFVWGNNDYEVDVKELNEVLIEEEIVILKDSSIKITRNEHSINMIGLDYHQDEEPQFNLDWHDIKGDYRILVTHVPSYFYGLDAYIQKNIHTVLAGHTHGGQIRIFGLGFYQRGGLNKYGQTNVLVSEGYGYTLLPLRLQTNAVCHVLTFRVQ